MLLQLAIGGAGILRISEHVVARSISEGLLQPLLQDAQDPDSYPLFALIPPGHHQAPKVGLHRFSDRAPRLRTVAYRAYATVAVSTGKFARVHVANFVGCLPAILFASAIWSWESEPKYV